MKKIIILLVFLLPNILSASLYLGFVDNTSQESFLTVTSAVYEKEDQELFIEIQIMKDVNNILYNFISEGRDDKALNYLMNQYTNVQYCVRTYLGNNVEMRKFFTEYTNAYKNKKQTKSELVLSANIYFIDAGKSDRIYDIDLTFFYDLSKNSYVEMQVYTEEIKKIKYLSSVKNTYPAIRLELGYDYVSNNLLEFLSIENLKDDIKKINQKAYDELMGGY